MKGLIELLGEGIDLLERVRQLTEELLMRWESLEADGDEEQMEVVEELAERTTKLVGWVREDLEEFVKRLSGEGE